MSTLGIVVMPASSALLPLEQVNSSVGPLAYLDLFARAAVETVSRACREELRTPVLWRRLVIPASSKESRLVNNVITWLFGNGHSYASLTSLDLKGCHKLTDGSIKAVAVNRGRLHIAHVTRDRVLLKSHE
jgi:hypothetical protein